MPYATVGILALAVLSFHALFQFTSGLEALYIVPIWLSVRLIGARASFVTVAVLSVILTLANPQISYMSTPAVLNACLVRLLGFSLVGVLVAWFEDSYNRARGLAYKDPLTGVLNRHALVDVKQRLFGKKHKDAIVVVLDCDGFKQVNDQYGHKAGDHILQILAKILEFETRASDALVRLGGDEFALILESATAEDARRVLERVQQRFETYVSDAGYECSISFGIAEPEAPEDDLDVVLAKADAAMYDQKRMKKQSYVA